MTLTDDSYEILISTENFTERCYRDKTDWLKVSARGRTFRITTGCSPGLAKVCGVPGPRGCRSSRMQMDSGPAETVWPAPAPTTVMVMPLLA